MGQAPILAACRWWYGPLPRTRRTLFGPWNRLPEPRPGSTRSWFAGFGPNLFGLTLSLDRQFGDPDLPFRYPALFYRYPSLRILFLILVWNLVMLDPSRLKAA